MYFFSLTLGPRDLKEKKIHCVSFITFYFLQIPIVAVWFPISIGKFGPLFNDDNWNQIVMGEQENADIKHIGSLPSLICASIKSSGVYKVKKKRFRIIQFFIRRSWWLSFS